MDFEEYIEIDPEKRFGRPIIKGTRISVIDAQSWTAQGMTVKNILYDFPELNENQIKACLL